MANRLRIITAGNEPTTDSGRTGFEPTQMHGPRDRRRTRKRALTGEDPIRNANYQRHLLLLNL
jgi:hypothetical protein